MVEAASVADQAAVKRALPGMSERRMSNIVNQRQSLSQIFIQAKSGSGGTGYLCDLDRVSQPAAKMVGGAAGKYLGLSGESTEGTRLHDPFTVTLKSGA
jgi:hypothetical protein